jgi:hypothetical protein
MIIVNFCTTSKPLKTDGIATITTTKPGFYFFRIHEISWNMQVDLDIQVINNKKAQLFSSVITKGFSSIHKCHWELPKQFCICHWEHHQQIVYTA